MAAPSPPSPPQMSTHPDSPGLHNRSSYLFSDTIRSASESNEKYGVKEHTQHIEQARQNTPSTALDELDHITEFPNKWARIRAKLREPAAEFLGTMILIIFGTGVDCQVVLSGSTAVAPGPKGEYLSISFGWAIGTALGVWGGHINPAVTLAQAIFRGFSWKKVPAYILSQVLGAMTGAGLVYANYHRAISLFEGGPEVRTIKTASLFTTFALDYLSNIQCFFSEVLATAILLLVVLAVTDRRNGPPPDGLVPLVLFITILGEGACLGMQTAYALNPARDLGPRLMCWMAVWNYRSQYWLYTPIIGPIVGAIAGTAIYDAFIFTGSESIFNKPDAATRRRHEHAPREAKGKIIPSGMDAV
ncbi:aquaporin, Major intrinsic protein family [Ceratobasidium sp. AG-Ba]|nr:aquaporin, Major intrinsic protein family [Ceratobasidium sp. AG-Ba]